jgi:hypothetical protein
VTSFGYFASLVPEGQFLCVLGFESLPLSEAYVDDAGQAWNVCKVCHAEDEAALARKRAREAAADAD